MTAPKSLFFLIFVPGLFIGYIPSHYLVFGPALPAGLTNCFALPHWLLGGLMILWCFWDFLVKGKVTPAPIDPPRQLVVSGLYRFVRNPMYVGVVLALLGNFLWFGFWSMLIYVSFFFVAFHMFILVYEEPNLRQRFGTAYENYCHAVPRWIPRFPR